MTRLNTSVRYTVRALLALAKAYNQPISIKEISKKEGISVKYLEQLFLKLRKAGLIKSLRGIYGGYVLAKSPDKIKLSDIIVAITKEGIYAAPCTKKGKKDCDRIKKCNARKYWLELQERLDNFFASHTLKDVI